MSKVQSIARKSLRDHPDIVITPRHGDHFVLPDNPMYSDILRRMIGSIVPTETGCWVWQKGVGGDGYPSMSVKSRQHRLNRLSYMVFNREGIPAGLKVCHSCDNPRCINPDHLWLGTAAQNNADKCQKGRAVGPARKLKPDDVRAIRIDSRSHREVARQYGVSHVSIINVRTGKSWRKVT